ncbi:MAG: bifunctional riboflavin kinase/FAD synthetase [Chloroflexota bacterium]|nr:bifunctional riboflavin kinase/FAD synthetase [Chloroflexota bacterium]
MKRLTSIDALPKGLRFVLAIGVFDGVHRGHRRVMAALRRAAARYDAQPVVLTFDPHPAQLLRGSAPPSLCDTAERLALLEREGVGTVIVQKFDHAFADQPPDAFLRRLCRDRQLMALVMTAESAFGRDRAGGLAAIRSLGPTLGFRVIEVNRLANEGLTVSSTGLRNLLAEGKLAAVRRLLGRDYAVIGQVVRGDKRGRGLGYPTANLHFDAPVALPVDGIYAVRAGWGGRDPLDPTRRADGVASLGVRPTFEQDGQRVLEVHLFDIDENLYGKRLRVEFVRRLRGERRFSSAAALVRQMDRDAARARAVLESNW